MCPKVGVTAVRAFDRVLGGVVLSFAGGVGYYYSIHSWLKNVRFNMSEVSQYTFSGRASMMRNFGGASDESEEDGEAMKNIATIAEEIILQSAQSDNCESMEVESEDESEESNSIVYKNNEQKNEAAWSASKYILRSPPTHCHPEQKMMHSEQVLNCELKRESSFSIYDMLPFLDSSDLDNFMDDSLCCFPCIPEDEGENASPIEHWFQLVHNVL